MNGHDVVQVNETVKATPDLEDEPIEIKAGWRGTIIGHADKPTPCILFDESYRGKPFIVDLDAANLEVVWANPFKIRTRIDDFIAATDFILSIRDGRAEVLRNSEGRS
jgi:hypothetical protein